jgi:hypothetical protein
MIAAEGFRLVEPYQVPDVFASGLGEIEDMDGCYRFTLFARRLQADGSEQCVVAAHVIVPHACLPAILLSAAGHVGMSLVRPAKFISGHLH